MTDVRGHAGLGAEFDVFARMLLGRAPDPGWASSYIRAHEAGTVDVGPATAMDRALLAMARISPATARAADAFAAVFSRSGLLRRKLVLVLAILESHAAPAAAMDTARPAPRPLWVVATGLRGLLWLLRLGVAGLVLGPLWIVCRIGGPGERRAA